MTLILELTKKEKICEKYSKIDIPSTDKLDKDKRVRRIYLNASTCTN